MNNEKLVRNGYFLRGLLRTFLLSLLKFKKMERINLTYMVSHFNQRMGISLKVSILEKNFPYKSCRVQRGPTYGDLELDLEVKDQGHFNALIF